MFNVGIRSCPTASESSDDVCYGNSYILCVHFISSSFTCALWCTQLCCSLNKRLPLLLRLLLFLPPPPSPPSFILLLSWVKILNSFLTFVIFFVVQLLLPAFNCHLLCFTSHYISMGITFPCQVGSFRALKYTSWFFASMVLPLIPLTFKVQTRPWHRFPFQILLPFVLWAPKLGNVSPRG